MREALKDFPEACDTTVEVAEKVRRGAGARLHPAALPLARGRDGGELLPQARAGGPGQALRRPSAARGAGARRLRDERHRPAGLSRRTSSSCRSTSNGRVARASAWARAVARPQAPSWRTPWTSPPWTRFPTACCSNASSRPNAWRCPISTSTSSRAAAKRSSTTSRTCTARTTCPRSSRSARCRPRTPCATPHACWTTRTTPATASAR